LEIDEDNEQHAMYLARMQVKTSTQAKGFTEGEAEGSTQEDAEESTHEVFVKFAPNYNEAAHRLLASQKPPLAPALHFCARVIGDMYMVVMEYIPESRGRSAGVLVHGPCYPPSLLRIVEQEVLKALRLLHEQQWVFGDLREPNLLYLPESGGRILLVDFDNVGRDGEATYSACLNPEGGFAPGVERGQVMKKEHDFGNLQMTLKRIRFALARA
jgi:serine/threonine protein kinase